MKRLIGVLLFSLGIYLLASNLIVPLEGQAVAEARESEVKISVCLPSDVKDSVAHQPEEIKSPVVTMGVTSVLRRVSAWRQPKPLLSYRQYFYMAFHLEDWAG
ncbi:MAG: hypothetical protein ACOX6G_03505 [Christensenellales bacterium]|jgi:hypothetical protein|nr:hypothetical protein [Clostridiales bacterium]